MGYADDYAEIMDRKRAARAEMEAIGFERAAAGSLQYRKALRRYRRACEDFIDLANSIEV